MNVTLNIRSVPPQIKQRILNEANERGVTLGDVAAGILAVRFNLPFQLSGRRTTIPSTGDQLTLRGVPGELAERLAEFACGAGLTRSSAAILVLAESFGVPYQPVRRGGRRRSAV